MKIWISSLSSGLPYTPRGVLNGAMHHVRFRAAMYPMWYIFWRPKPCEVWGSHVPFVVHGAPSPARTGDLRIRSPTLYPTELWAHFTISDFADALNHVRFRIPMYPTWFMIWRPELRGVQGSHIPYVVYLLAPCTMLGAWQP